MKPPKDDLFRLIHAMDKAEKSYFRRHFAISNTALTQLYDIIDKLESYDEAIVKAKLPVAARKNLKYNKVQLMDLLLESLTLFQRKQGVISKIRNGLLEVEVFMSKQLYGLAKDRLKKVKNMAQQYEEFTYLIEIANKEYYLYQTEINKIGIVNFPGIKEVKIYLEHLQTQNELARLNLEVVDLVKRNDFNLHAAPLQVIFQEMSMQPVLHSNQLSFRAMLTKNSVLTHIYQVLKNPEKEYFYRKSNMMLFEQFPHFKANMPNSYLAVLNNLGNFYFNTNQHTKLKDIITTAKTFIDANSASKTQVLFFYQLEITMYLAQQQYEIITEILEKQVIAFISYCRYPIDRILLLIFAQLSIASIFMGKHARAQSYLRKIEDADAQLHSTFKFIYKIIELINHYASGDHRLVKRETLLHKKKLPEEPAAAAFYETCLDLFAKLIAQPSKAKQTAQTYLSTLAAMASNVISAQFYYFKLNHCLEAIADRHS